MTNQVSSLLSLEIASIASGYRALDVLTKNGVLRILDASPLVAGRFLILALGATAEVDRALKATRLSLDGVEPTLLLDHEIIENVQETLLEAVFSLSQVPLAESLLVVECETVSGLLSIAQDLVSQYKLQPIELRILRAGVGGATGYFTGKTEACAPGAEHARTRLTHDLRRGRSEHIENPSREFRQFFNLSGET